MSLYYAMCFQAGNSQQSIRILAHIRLAAVLPFFLVEQLSISYKHGLHLANLRSQVLVAHWRALSLMGRHSIIVAGKTPGEKPADNTIHTMI